MSWTRRTLSLSSSLDMVKGTIEDLFSSPRKLLMVSLYPFNEGTNVASKALMPVGNVPIVNLVLDWVIDAGLTGEQRLPDHGLES